jgi:multidrug efflux pump subunit AcrB
MTNLAALAGQRPIVRAGWGVDAVSRRSCGLDIGGGRVVGYLLTLDRTPVG